MDLETVIVGGGQAGLSAAYFLHQLGREYLILDRSALPAHAWRNDRWDSFTLVSPNWTFRLPGGEYDGSQPDGYMQRDEIVQRFETYIDRHSLSVEYGVEVEAVEPVDSAYKVQTSQDSYRAKNVVIATGLYQRPKLPVYSAKIDAGILQLHSGQYRNPDSLPPGAVLVIGSGQSGCQIAEELYQSGRRVYLSTSSVGRAPRRYRGKDIFDWLNRIGFFDRTPDKLPSPQARFGANPLVSGKNGGHSLNLHCFFRDGVTLLGRSLDVQDSRLTLAPDLKDSLAKSDAFEANLIRMIDEFIAARGLEAPEEEISRLNDAYSAPEILTLDLQAAGIAVVIWAMGYAFDFSLVKLPVFESNGFPITDRGASRFPGLYFLGLPWLHTQKGGLLVGVADDAAHICSQIAGA